MMNEQLEGISVEREKHVCVCWCWYVLYCGADPNVLYVCVVMCCVVALNLMCVLVCIVKLNLMCCYVL